MSEQHGSYIGYKPRQVIPEREKNRDWVMENLNYFISLTDFENREINKLYRAYNGEREEEDFEYITKTYGIEYPAKLKHVPLIKPLIERIRGEEWRRSMDFVLRANDSESVELKQQEMSRLISEQIIDITKNVSNPEERENKIQELEQYYRNKYQSAVEEGASKFLSHLKDTLDIRQKSAELMHERLVTGRGIYKCTVENTGEDPDFRVVDPANFWYSADDDVKWISDAEWCVERVRMSPTEIMDRFGHDLSAEEHRKIEDYIEMYDKGAIRLNSGSELDNIRPYNQEAGSVNTPASIDVYYVQFKSIREVKLLESENKYDPTSPFIKLIGDDDIRTLTVEKRNKVQRRYVQDLYEGVRIGTDIFANLGKCKYAPRSMGKPSKVRLHYNGLVNGFHHNEPYSLVKATKDLQDLYDILHYHKENLIALSGTKGVIMDLAQLPSLSEGASEGEEEDVAEDLKMWLYYKKLGVMFIDRSKETVDKSFNQFKDYDDSLGPGVQAILAMIQHVENVASRVTGVNRQSMGQQFQYDGKGVTEQSILQSSYTTEPIFMEHYLTLEKMLEDLINAAKYSYPNGIKSSYITTDFMTDVFTLDREFSTADYGVRLVAAHQNNQDLQEIKTYAIEMAKNQQIDLKDMVSLVGKESIAEVKRELSQAYTRKQTETREMQKQQQEAQQKAEQAKAQAEQAKLQFEQQKHQDEMALKRQELEAEKKDNEKDRELERVRVELEKLQLYTDPKSAEVRND